MKQKPLQLFNERVSRGDKSNGISKESGLTHYCNLYKQVFVINIDKPEEQLILLHRNKHDFDHIQIYVEHDQHSEKVTYYKILERAAGTNGNLILFAEKEK